MRVQNGVVVRGLPSKVGNCGVFEGIDPSLV